MNETTEKWRKTGLLEDIENETRCDELALELENMEHHLLKDVPSYTKESEQFESIESMMLPIVRRLWENIHPPLSTEWLYNDFKRFYTEQKELKEECKRSALYKIDEEAQFIAYYVDYMVSRFEPDSDLNVKEN